MPLNKNISTFTSAVSFFKKLAAKFIGSTEKYSVRYYKKEIASSNTNKLPQPKKSNLFE
jgi:hypothetical protein